ncbi:hypothetical protein ACQR35_11670 [Pseudarthrobacter sp. J1738]|uniref:hypothetical protein n=1 Tax=unclassified Pseudarthrobacter TaxID=2647000 RepID=UPI003D275244
MANHAAYAFGGADFSTVAQLPERGRARCRGYIESVTFAPWTATPVFTAIVVDLDEGKTANELKTKRTNRVKLVWLGRRRVRGIDPGTQIRFEGMVSHNDSIPTIFNPRYEILAHQEH